MLASAAAGLLVEPSLVRMLLCKDYFGNQVADVLLALDPGAHVALLMIQILMDVQYTSDSLMLTVHLIISATHIAIHPSALTNASDVRMKLHSAISTV